MAKYPILYRKKTGKKNPSWEFDGFLRYGSGVCCILDSDGEFVAKAHVTDFSIDKYVKRTFFAGNYECILDDPMPGDDSLNLTAQKPIVKVQRNVFKPPTIRKNQPKPLSSITNHINKRNLNPLYDINSDDKSLVLENPVGSGAVYRPVVVDPALVMKLRPHQKSGVEFLYKTLIQHKGSILADDMGMGKTLQTIAVIHTMLKQSPYPDKQKLIDKVLICCPVSLVQNWSDEFKKWLGLGRCPTLAITGSKNQNEIQDIKSFPYGKNKVLIIGYEKMVNLKKELANISFDMLVCDEGHRLKNSDNKTIKALESFNIPYKLLISGTPIQNDLGEFHTLVNFVRPGILGEIKEFEKNFMNPILRSRDPHCSHPDVLSKGREKSAKLNAITQKFVIRRSNEELKKYLPPRIDYVLMIPPTILQLEIFKTILLTDRFQTMVNSATDSTTSLANDSLSLISTFRKLCTSPSMLSKDGLFLDIVSKTDQSEESTSFRAQLSKKIKSGKLLLLLKMLAIIGEIGDKIIIVSSFTTTLDLIQNILVTLKVTYTRLDGTTPQQERSQIVKRFNKSDTYSVMLLSTRAGGTGLNLIGANRLILFDTDWNPAVDDQAMARVHRDGQTKPVFIYRFITRGTVEEKIWQRGVQKTGLAKAFAATAGDSSQRLKDTFTQSDLRDLFKVEGVTGEGTVSIERQGCQTHELLCCGCDGDAGVMQNGKLYDESDQEDEEEGEGDNEKNINEGFKPATQFTPLEIKRRIRGLKGYRHYNPLMHQIDIRDDVLNKVIAEQKDKILVGYAFAKY